MKRCPQCKKILFKKKDGTLFCPNECDKHEGRAAFNTFIDRDMDRRSHNPESAYDTFKAWSFVR